MIFHKIILSSSRTLKSLCPCIVAPFQIVRVVLRLVEICTGVLWLWISWPDYRCSLSTYIISLELKAITGELKNCSRISLKLVNRRFCDDNY